jgi:hypothetical protein
MAYSLDQGIGPNGSRLDRVQRALLVGLPALALALLIGAIISRHSSNPPAGAGAQQIPVVSTIQTTGSHSSSGKGNNASQGNAGSGLSASASAQPAGGSSLLGFSPVSPGTSSGSGSSGGTGGVIGGLGGGPTGGGGGTSGGSGGGTVITTSVITIGATCTTTTCTVTGCTQPETISYGQKIILGLSGVCSVVDPTI